MNRLRAGSDVKLDVLFYVLLNLLLFIQLNVQFYVLSSQWFDMNGLMHNLFGV